MSRSGKVPDSVFDSSSPQQPVSGSCCKWRSKHPRTFAKDAGMMPSEADFVAVQSFDWDEWSCRFCSAHSGTRPTSDTPGSQVLSFWVEVLSLAALPGRIAACCVMHSELAWIVALLFCRGSDRCMGWSFARLMQAFALGLPHESGRNLCLG